MTEGPAAILNADKMMDYFIMVPQNDGVLYVSLYHVDFDMCMNMKLIFNVFNFECFQPEITRNISVMIYDCVYQDVGLL